MSTRLKLLRDIFAAMYIPIATKPFHWVASDSRCLLLNGSRTMNGSKAKKLKLMWHVVKRRGNRNP